MPRPKTKTVKSFALPFATMDKLRKVAEETQVAGGMSAIANDALKVWLRRYDEGPKEWLLTRGLPVPSEPSDEI